MHRLYTTQKWLSSSSYNQDKGMSNVFRKGGAMKIEWIADVQRVYCILPEEGECTIGIAPLTNFEAVYGFLHELGHVATSPKGELLRTM